MNHCHYAITVARLTTDSCSPNQLSRIQEKETERTVRLSLIRCRWSPFTPDISVLRKKKERDRSRNVSILSRGGLWKFLCRGEKERGEDERYKEESLNDLGISGSGRLWGQIIGLRPITRWRRRYIEESGCRRVPRIVLAAKNKIPPGSGDYVPKKEEPGETLALFVCAGGGDGMRRGWYDDIRTQRERKRDREEKRGVREEREWERKAPLSWWIVRWGPG